VIRITQSREKVKNKNTFVLLFVVEPLHATLSLPRFVFICFFSSVHFDLKFNFFVIPSEGYE